MTEQCDSVYDLGGFLLRCEGRAGHKGIHMASVTINGQDCDTGWKDSEAAHLDVAAS